MRFRSRHVHQSCFDYLQSGLTDLGWVDPPINFGATAVTFLAVQPEEGGITVDPNTVAITLGDEPADQPEELGAGLESCDYTLFVDVYGENNAIAMSLADDIKALLKDLYLPLRDYATGELTPYTIEMDYVIVDCPALVTGIDKRYWRSVKATARLLFQEED